MAFIALLALKDIITLTDVMALILLKQVNKNSNHTITGLYYVIIQIQ